MLAIGGLKAAAKRTAFGDVSNTVKNLQATRDDSAVAGKQVNIDFVKPIIAQDKQPAFLRPAQRPINNNAAKVAQNSTAAADLVAITSVLKTEAKQQAPGLKRTQSKKLPPIFKDDDAQDRQQAHAIETSARPESATIPPVHQNLEPRTQTSQLQLAQEQPHIRRTESKILGVGAVEAPVNQLTVEPSFEDARQEQQVLEQTDAVEVRKSIPLVLNEEYESYMKTLMSKQEESWLNAEDNEKMSGQQRELPALPNVSEPEEYWEDEEEEVYDEQGYTTAHSYRSRGDNTTGGATTVLFPKITNKVKQELAAAKELVESQRSQEEIEDEAWDTSMVAEYGDEIFSYMRELEVCPTKFFYFPKQPDRVSEGRPCGRPSRPSCGQCLHYNPCRVDSNGQLLTSHLQIKMLPNAHYMDLQTEIQWSMRSVLMDWLIQVHHRFSLLPETLFLCVNYIDRFLSCKIVSLGKLQLVGATAIFVAAKYEEINCPSVNEIVYMVDGGYTVDEILKAERFMLSMLQFELGWPGPMSFLRRISKADDYDLETRTLAKYFLEVTIMDERFVGSPPSYIAAGAHCFARLLLKKGEWVCQP